MDIKEFNRLKRIEKNWCRPIEAADLFDMSDRTLLYGYTCNRDTFHVYVKDMKIHTIIYNTCYTNNTPINVREIDVQTNHDYIPDKRIYPEASDLNFCEILAREHDLPFTYFDENREKKQYYGFILEDCI